MRVILEGSGALLDLPALGQAGLHDRIELSRGRAVQSCEGGLHGTLGGGGGGGGSSLDGEGRDNHYILAEG